MLQAAVDYAIRGDIDPTPIRGREITSRIEAAAAAVSMLELHAGHIRAVQSRSTRLALVVEHAAKADRAVAPLWRRMNANRCVVWATRTLLGKSGTMHLRTADVKDDLLGRARLGNYRLLTDYARLDADQYEQWILDYYLRMFALRS